MKTATCEYRMLNLFNSIYTCKKSDEFFKHLVTKLKYEEVDGLIYEINENGERSLVKSIDSRYRVYLRFCNRTSRPVNVWWRDFSGAKHLSIRLEKDQWFDINTFLTHPWEFTDADTEERYLVNGLLIYRAPKNLYGLRYRMQCDISIPLRTLRSTVLIALAKRLSDPKMVEVLELPKILKSELQRLVVMFHKKALGSDPATTPTT